MLRRWWVKKYKLPPTSAEFLAYTNEELWVEFYEDYYEAHPQEALDDLTEHDNVQFVTGDAEFDALESRIVEGASDEEILAAITAWESGDGVPENDVDADADQEEVFRQLEELGEGFADNYQG